MISSIILLLVLQAFWLRSSYEKAYFDLRRETNGLFRSTVLTLRDTLLLRSFEQVSVDTLQRETLTFNHRIDSGSKGETNTGQGFAASHVQIFISSENKTDSIQALLRPLSAKIKDGRIKQGNFIFRMRPDSLSKDSIQSHYNMSLAKAGLHIAFSITHSSDVPSTVQLGDKRALLRTSLEDSPDEITEARIFSDSIYSEWVHFDPIHRYAVILSGVRPLILKEIAPQIFFSVFLTILTCTAFFFMYRNIRAQQKLMELKNDFISNITHELKTPVTTVSVALEALKNFRGLENPKLTEEYLDIAQNELNRLTILTDKILKTAVFENKGVSFQPEPVDLEKLITQILGSMKLLFEKQRAKVTFEKNGENFVVSGGSVHLTNVIYNLLDNALKYSPHEPNIQVSLINDDSKIEILVKDEGIGIPTEFRKKIFEKFFRVPTGDVHNIKGYGLGLSYVDSVIRSHRGTIEVESGKGQGSVFKIVLPK